MLSPFFFLPSVVSLFLFTRVLFSGDFSSSRVVVISSICHRLLFRSALWLWFGIFIVDWIRSTCVSGGNWGFFLQSWFLLECRKQACRRVAGMGSIDSTMPPRPGETVMATTDNTNRVRRDIRAPPLDFRATPHLLPWTRLQWRNPAFPCRRNEQERRRCLRKSWQRMFRILGLLPIVLATWNGSWSQLLQLPLLSTLPRFRKKSPPFGVSCLSSWSLIGVCLVCRWRWEDVGLPEGSPGLILFLRTSGSRLRSGAPTVLVFLLFSTAGPAWSSITYPSCPASSYMVCWASRRLTSGKELNYSISVVILWSWEQITRNETSIWLF